MDKQEHADLLRRAIDQRPDMTKHDVAEVLQRSYRTVSNWTSPTKPTMPTAHERAALRQLLGPYDSPGDEVERAVRRSELLEWRQEHVIGEYKRHLYEQESLKGVRDA